MRSLFVRIVISFWVANALVMMAGTLVYWTAPPRPDLSAILTELVRPRASDAVVLLDAGDRDGAARSLEDLRAIGGPSIVLLRDGEVILGADREGVRALAADVAHRHATHTATIEGTELVGVIVPSAAGEVVAIGHTPAFVRLFPSALMARLVMLVFVSGIVSFLLARYVARPIQALRDASQRLAAGDTTVRVAESVRGRSDEVAELARDFDRMAERIAALLDVQTRLLLDVSHELRSPLARLTVALELARQKVGPEAQPALDRMEREADRLAELVSEVLTLARLEHREAGARDDVALDPLLKELCADADFEAKAMGKQVRFDGAVEATVRGDEELLRRAIENVLRNAVRFTKDVVEVSASREGGRIAITIRDHGPGVPSEALEGIFRPFYRVGTARDRASGGAGLGLAITERAIRAHEGAVHAANAEGGGLLVTLALPASAPTREQQ